MLQLRNISKVFENKVVIQDLNLEITPGEFVPLVGSSGSGKSTILRLIAGLEAPSQGAVQWTSPEASTSFSFVFQDANLLPWKTVSENIELPFQVGILKNKYSVTEIKNKIQEVLKKVQLEEAAHLFPHQLSGGMKMRVSLARALVTEPKVFLMDEPFAALDEVTRFQMQNLLLELSQKENITVIFVTHSLFEAAYLSNKVLLLKSGRTSEFTLDLPTERNEKLRTSEIMFHTVQRLSERFRE